MKRISMILVGCLTMLFVAGGALAQQGTAAKKQAAHAKAAKPAKSMFLIESPHTEEECMSVMDEVNKSGPKELASWHWGCESGNHTGYRMVMAADENAALAMVPEAVRSKAHAYKVSKMTPAQLEAAHKHKM